MTCRRGDHREFALVRHGLARPSRPRTLAASSCALTDGASARSSTPTRRESPHSSGRLIHRSSRGCVRMRWPSPDGRDLDVRELRASAWGADELRRAAPGRRSRRSLRPAVRGDDRCATFVTAGRRSQVPLDHITGREARVHARDRARNCRLRGLPADQLPAFAAESSVRRAGLPSRRSRSRAAT